MASKGDTRLDKRVWLVVFHASLQNEEIWCLFKGQRVSHVVRKEIDPF